MFSSGDGGGTLKSGRNSKDRRLSLKKVEMLKLPAVTDSMLWDNKSYVITLRASFFY